MHLDLLRMQGVHSHESRYLRRRQYRLFFIPRAPRHGDASRDFLFFIFSPNEQRAGGGGGALPDWGGGAARLFFFFFPCSADHERDWPLCKVVFFGLATNALNVRNNSNNSY